MYHMRKASLRDLRYEFKKIERLLRQGEEIQITKRRRVIAAWFLKTHSLLLSFPTSEHACALSMATRYWLSAALTW
jgi:hypothetical protein